MNNKKIVGNGSKATLPDGKKMEDYKKPPSYNSLAKTNTQAGSGNNSEQTEGKQKSKGEQVAQNASSEALKASLKAAFPYIPQFIINKLVDSNLGQAVIEKQLKQIKMKITLAVVGVVVGIVGSILGVCVIMAAILGPVGALGDVAKGIGKFFSSIGNLFVYGEYCADESSCQEILSNKYYDTLEKKVNDAFENCDNVDKGQVKDLITGTIFYDQMSYEYDYESESQESIESEKEADKEEGYIQQETTGGYFDYRGKRGDIDSLVKKLKSDDDSSCVLNSFAYRNYLTNNYVRNNYKYVLKGEFKNGVEGRLTIDEVVNEIMMIGGFEQVGYAGSCSNSCSYEVNGQTVSNLKVKLLQGTDLNFGEPIEGEELVSFEKYILGVVYGEVGSSASVEVAKAQAVAARSYSLTRGSHIGGDIGIHQENGEWILYIRNSTEDQVYCDPDKGCSKIGNENSTVFSDPDKYNYYKGPLATDSPLREYVSEVIGELAINSSDEVVYTAYTDTNQIMWADLASQGYSYTDILKKDYEDIGFSNIKKSENCSSHCSFATGDFTKWYQGDPSWGSIVIGYGTNGKVYTMANSGCLITAVAKQIARSGVATPLVDNFNPGTLIGNYKDTLVNSGGGWKWYEISKIIPNFVYNSNFSSTNLAGKSQAEQIKFLQEGLKNQCYYVMEVKSYNAKSRRDTHYVALDTIVGNEIYIMETSGRNNTTINSGKSSEGYQYHISNAHCYQVKG